MGLDEYFQMLNVDISNFERRPGSRATVEKSKILNFNVSNFECRPESRAKFEKVGRARGGRAPSAGFKLSSPQLM